MQNMLKKESQTKISSKSHMKFLLQLLASVTIHSSKSSYQKHIKHLKPKPFIEPQKSI
jgi:hypothetical protein